MEHPFLQAFKQYWQTHFAAFKPSSTELIVAVSGGVDSIVLAYVLDQLGFDFIVAHCNFHLRGEESNRDENFVRQYAEKIGKTFVCKDFDTVSYAKENKLSIEEAARNLRYGWFRSLAEERKIGESALPIFVAHHANDNVETVLMNFFRGCGIAGLHGILPIKNGIFRPLLFAKRNEIVRFALSKQLTWIEDSTNTDEKYTRNFLRHNIIPELTETFSTLEDNILENIARFKEVEILYNDHIALLKKKLVQYVDGTHQINIEQLKSQNALATIIFEIFKDFGFNTHQTNEILKLLDAQTGAKLTSETHVIWKDRDMLIVSSVEDCSEEMIVWQKDTDRIVLPDGSSFSQAIQFEDTSSTTIQLDKETLQFPLEIRHWRDGDFFYPAGMQGKKKLAKFFIDLKIPNPIKQKIWILTSNEKIVWIVGYRADRRFIASENTSHIYHLTYSPAL